MHAPRTAIVAILIAGLMLAPAVAVAVQVQPGLGEQLNGELREATKAYNEGKLPEAIAKLDTLISRVRPDQVTDTVSRDLYLRALFLRGRAHLLRNETEAAKSDFRLLLTVKPDYAPDPSVSPRIVTAFNDVRSAAIGALSLRILPANLPADAEVQLDNRVIALKDGLLVLTAGQHSLRVTCPGYRTFAETFEVPGGGTIEKTVELERVSAVLRFITSPPDVAVSIDGKPQGKTIPGPPGESWTKEILGTGRSPEDFSAEFLLTPVGVGRVELAFRKPCFVTLEEGWDVKALKNYHQSPIVLKKAVGSIRIAGPEGSVVSVDGVSRGVAPLSIELCEGEHRIDIRAAEGRDIQTLSIAVDQSETLSPRLRPVIALLDVVRLDDKGDPTSIARTVPDRRVDLERRLATTNTLFWAPPLASASAKDAGTKPGWLSYSVDREPESTEARLKSPAQIRETSGRLGKELDVQAVAEMRLRSSTDRDQNDYLLSILAQGSSVPDVVAVNLGSGPSVSRAISAIDAMPDVYRASVGLVVADVMDLAGVVVTRVSSGGAAKAAGIAEGDIIERIDGQPKPAFRELLMSKKAGDVLEVNYRDRNGTLKSARLPVALVPCVISTGDETWLPNVLVAVFRARLMSNNDSALRLNLAVALMRLRNWEAALTELARVDLPLGPGVSAGTVQFLIGECYAELGIAEKARQAWQAAAATDHLLTQDGPPVRELVPAKLAALGKI